MNELEAIVRDLASRGIEPAFAMPAKGLIRRERLITMKQDIKALWVNALRSGDYEQGSAYLTQVTSEDGKAREYCCLGVLCDVAIKAGLPLVATTGGMYHRYLQYGEDKDSCYLPDEVIEWADMSEANPHVTVEQEGRYSLADLNDDGIEGGDGSFTFGQIADLIEQQL